VQREIKVTLSNRFLISKFHVIILWVMILQEAVSYRPTSVSKSIPREKKIINIFSMKTDRKLRAVQKKLKLSRARVHSALQSSSVGTSRELRTTIGSRRAGPPYTT
jgi:hypothetical protein